MEKKRKFTNLTNSVAIHWNENLENTPLGVKVGKTNSLIAQFHVHKNQYSTHIILMRVGEFYHAYGVDAIMLVEHAQTTPEKNEIQTCVHSKKIQFALSRLVKQRLSVAIFEESEVLKTPRERYFAQIVDESVPVYTRAPDAYEYDMVEARPCGSLYQSADGVSICLVYVQERVCRVYHKILEVAAEALISHAREPVLVFRSSPKWLKHVKIDYAGIDPYTSLMSRTLMHVCHEYKISPTEFRQICVKNGRCSPLSTFTLTQLGLSHDSFGVPSLSEACLPNDAPALIKNQFKQWLNCPPDDESADAFQNSLSKLTTSVESIPKMLPARPGRRLGQLQTKLESGCVLNDLLVNIDAFLGTALVELKQLLLEQFSATVESVVTLRNTIRNFFAEEVSFLDDMRGSSHSIKMFVHKHMLDLDEFLRANDAFALVLSKYDEDQLVRDSKGICIQGKPDGNEKLAVPEKRNQNIHTTSELLSVDLNLRTAHDNIAQQQKSILHDCLRQIYKLQNSINVVETFALYATTLWYHARLAISRSWTMCDKGDILHVKDLVPYWMNEAIKNDVIFDDIIMILTGPNGGGKSTLLRGVAAVAILSQCGFFSPCAKGSRMPRFNSIFLRTGSLDCARERRSSFANEMVDLTAILSTRGKVLVLVDEPCSSTRPSEGSHLLASILNNMHDDVVGIITTHFDEVKSTNERVKWYKLDAALKDYDCVPEFVLKPGQCTDSMAIRVAIAAGLPRPVVKELLRHDDTESQVLDVIYNMGLKASKWVPGEFVSAMHLSVLYILILDKSVYVGETDRLFRRFRTHIQQKKPYAGYIINVTSKSQAMLLESRMQQELTFYNVNIESLTDMLHDV